MKNDSRLKATLAALGASLGVAMVPVALAGDGSVKPTDAAKDKELKQSPADAKTVKLKPADSKDVKLAPADSKTVKLAPADSKTVKLQPGDANAQKVNPATGK